MCSRELTLLILAALIEEPSACRALVRELAEKISRGDELGKAPIRMLQRVPADILAQASDELKQRSRRFLESASTCRVCGVIDTMPEDGDNDGAPKPGRKQRRVVCAPSPGQDDNAMKLGLTQRANKPTRNTEHLEQLLKFAQSYEGRMAAAIGAKDVVRAAAAGPKARTHIKGHESQENVLPKNPAEETAETINVGSESLDEPMI